MVFRNSRQLGVVTALALVASLFTVTPADATVTQTTKGTAQLYDIVEAAYVLNDSRIVVLSNDTSNAVIQLVNPTTRAVTDTLAFTAPNADGSNAWTVATDMAISTDGLTAFVAFAGSNYALAKINLSSFTVADFVSISGGSAIYGGGAPEFVALRGNQVHVFSRTASKSFAMSSLDATDGWFTVGPEIGVTNQTFVSDPTSSKTFWADITDGSMSGNSRLNFLGDNGLYYAANFSSNSIADAITLNHDLGEIYVGTTYSGATLLSRIDGYPDSNNISGDDIFTLDASFDGVRQVAASTDGTQLVALSDNGRIARIPLGRGWNSSLVDYYTLSSAGITVGTLSAIAVKSDGSQVTYLDSRTGSNDNIVNFTLANNTSTVPTVPLSLGWYARNKKVASLYWDAPADNGGSPILDYSVQCTNGKTQVFNTIKTSPDEDYPGTTVTRNAKKKIKCRVVARNAIGNSDVSNVITVTARGKRGPGPF